MSAHAAAPEAGPALLCDQVPDVAYRVRGAEGTIESLSAAFEAVTGWPAAKWVGHPFAELVHPDDLPSAVANYQAVLRGETPEPFELRIRTPAGSFVVGEFHSAPLIEGRRVVGELGIARDVTARKRADEAAKASAERFRTLFETADDAILMMDGSAFIDVNPKCIEMFGLRDRSDMVGRSPVDFSPPVQPDGRNSSEKARAYIQAAEQGRPQRFYWKHVRLGGEPFDAEVSLNALTLHGAVFLQAIVRDVTARRAADEATRESEERFRLLSEAAFEGVGISEEGRIVACNTALAAMLGYTPEEMIGRPVADFVAPEHADLVATHHRSHSTQRYEHAARRKDGTTLWVEVQGRPLPHRGRNLRVSAIRDVTERRRSELIQGATFRISEAAHTGQTLQELFAAIHRIIGELMPARNFYIALYDADRDELSFPYFVDEFDTAPEPKRPGKGLTEYVLRTGRPLLATPEVHRELEERGEAELIGAPSVDWLGVPLVADNQPLGVLVVQVYASGERYTERDRDMLQFVSRQVAMAVQRKRAEAALRASEERLQSLFAGIDDALFVHDAEGRILDCNEAACRRLGYSRAELLGRRTSDFSAFETAEGVRAGVAEQRDRSRFSGEGVYVARDGRRIPVDVSTSVIEYHGRNAVLAVVRDVTERRALEAQLRQAQKMEAVGQLAGGVAHDFNNLLTTILASTELLSAAMAADAPHREDVEMIRQAGQRAAELTRDLLAFSRQQALELRAVPLGSLVTGFARLARRIVPENVDVVVHAGTPGAVVRADPGAVEQILMNLATNARDAMPHGGTLRLAVEEAALDEAQCRAQGWGKPGPYVLLSVTDTGAGMDASTLQRIFEPFFTTKPVGVGTGLGLSMVYGLVKQQDGFIGIESEPGRGTTVRMYFPPAAEPAGSERAPAPSEIREGHETILLVEDDATLRRTAKRVLEKFGYTVVTATDGREAVNLVRSGRTPVDLIISDVVMPHLSGPQLLRTLRDSGEMPRILFTSGYTARDVHERSALEGGVPFLAKPWTVAELLGTVRRILDGPAAS